MTSHCFHFLPPFFFPPSSLLVVGSCEGHSFSSYWNRSPFEVVWLLLLTDKEFLQSQQSAGESQTALVLLPGDRCGKCGAEVRTSSLMVAVVGPIYVPALCYWGPCRSQVHTERGCKPCFSVCLCVCLHVCQWFYDLSLKWFIEGLKPLGASLLLSLADCSLGEWWSCTAEPSYLDRLKSDMTHIGTVHSGPHQCCN